jgi:hypothetical protein
MKKLSFKNVLKKLAITTFGIMLTSQVVFAANSWSDARTYQLSAGSGYTTVTTTGNKLGQNKETDASKWTLYTVSKTMYTSPVARLVNSSGDIRTDVVTTASSGRSVNGSVNTGTIGYAEYLSVKPAGLQAGVDTIKLQFKNY